MTSRHSLILISAIIAALAAPLAFAQNTPASAAAMQHADAQAAMPAFPATPAVPAASPTEETSAMAATPAVPATPATPVTPATPPTEGGGAMAATPAMPATPATPSAKKVNWSQLDSDGDGKLTRIEAAAVKSLGKVFDKADTDKDGALTADEYKAYLAAHGKRAHANNG